VPRRAIGEILEADKTERLEELVKEIMQGKLDIEREKLMDR